MIVRFKQFKSFKSFQSFMETTGGRDDSKHGKRSRYAYSHRIDST
jgi:hypothetical protein